MKFTGRNVGACPEVDVVHDDGVVEVGLDGNGQLVVDDDVVRQVDAVAHICVAGRRHRRRR